MLDPFEPPREETPPRFEFRAIGVFILWIGFLAWAFIYFVVTIAVITGAIEPTLFQVINRFTTPVSWLLIWRARGRKDEGQKWRA